MRVGVVGAGGRMGREVCRTVLARPGLELVAAVDPEHAGSMVGDADRCRTAPSGAVRSPSPPHSTRWPMPAPRWSSTSPQLEVSRATIAFCADAGIHTVVGTTGFTESDLADLARRFDPASGSRANCVVAANFAIGAVLMMRFAAMAAPWFDGAEIIELHHEGKRDSPSGTSLRTAEGMAASAGGGTAAASSRPTPPASLWSKEHGGRRPRWGAHARRSGSRVSWPTRRSSSAPRDRASPSATTPTTGPRSWTAWSWP